MLHACLKGCSRVFNRDFSGCFKEVSRVIKKKFHVCFKEVSGVCQEHFKGDSRKFSGCFRTVFRVVEGGSQRVSTQFQRRFPKVSRKFLSVLWKFKEYFKEV